MESKDFKALGQLFDELVPENGKCDSLAGSVVNQINLHPELRNCPTEDMLDCRNPQEDVDDSCEDGGELV